MNNCNQYLLDFHLRLQIIHYAGDGGPYLREATIRGLYFQNLCRIQMLLPIHFYLSVATNRVNTVL